MKLLLKQTFTIEIPTETEIDEVITGTLSPLSKSQLKEFKEHFKRDQEIRSDIKKIRREINALNDEDLKIKNELEDKIDILIKELNELDTEEESTKLRIELSVQSDHKARIIEIAELVSYAEVLDIIVKDIEIKKGNAMPV